jgi:hypothetical protein
MLGVHTAGAKARADFAAFTARLKSCPDASSGQKSVFPKAVKPAVRRGAIGKMGRRTVIYSRRGLASRSKTTAAQDHLKNWAPEEN